MMDENDVFFIQILYSFSGEKDGAGIYEGTINNESAILNSPNVKGLIYNFSTVLVVIRTASVFMGCVYVC